MNAVWRVHFRQSDRERPCDAACRVTRANSSPDTRPHPGGTSWTWSACENGRCLNIMICRRLATLSADGFRFTRNSNVLKDFEKAAHLSALFRATYSSHRIQGHRTCGRASKRGRETPSGGRVCRRYVETARDNLPQGS
jgi:metallo-beta-lactamase class B